MVDQKKVKPLFELASVATYHRIISQIEHQLRSSPTTENDVGASSTCQPKKKRKVDSFYVYSNKYKPPNIVKAQLDEYLVGWYSHLRPQLVQRFIHNYCHQDQGTARSNMKLCLSFFDSVLDQSFTSFDLTAIKRSEIFWLADPNHLLEIITKRSPLLQTLDLTFRSRKRTPTMDLRFGLLLGKLTQLTSLTLSFQTSGECLDFFSSLGQFCPQLVTLCLSQFPFGVDQVLALMLGNKRALLSPEFPKDNDKLADVQFSPKSLTPICNSLKELCYDSFFGVPVSFLLRHFKKMEKWQCSKHKRFKYSGAIMRWLNEKSAHPIVKRKSHRLLQKNKTITITSKEIGDIQWKIDAPFIDQLKLVSIDNVPIKSRKEIMQTVISSFPNLKEIDFDGNPDEIITADDLLSLQEVLSLVLRKKSAICNRFWSKVNRVGLCNVSSDYRRAVLSILGHQLQSLSLSETTNIDVIAELEPCHQLQELNILSCSLLPPPTADVDFPSADNFLPHLKKLKINICIGPWSPLFERERPLLTELDLRCPHIGMTPRSKFNWIDVPYLWPNLREMTLYKSEGLTVDTLREIVPKLKHLERLTIPKFLVGSPNEKLHLNAFRDELLNKQEPADSVLLSFRHFANNVYHY